MVPTRAYYFQRSGLLVNSSITTGADGKGYGSAYAAGLTAVANITIPDNVEFTQLFDQYKILSYTAEYMPRWDSVDTAQTSGFGVMMPTFHWVYDMDDATIPTTVEELMTRPYCKSVPINKPIRITVKNPCVAGMIYQSGVATSYSPRKSPWVDCNNNSVPHYGYKFCVTGKPTTTYTFDVKVTIRLMMKNVR